MHFCQFFLPKTSQFENFCKNCYRVIVAESKETKRQLNVRASKTRKLEQTTGNLTHRMMGVESRLAHFQRQTSNVENATQNINRQIEYFHNSTRKLISGKCMKCKLLISCTTPQTCQHDPFCKQSLHHYTIQQLRWPSAIQTVLFKRRYAYQCRCAVAWLPVRGQLGEIVN